MTRAAWPHLSPLQGGAARAGQAPTTCPPSATLTLVKISCDCCAASHARHDACPRGRGAQGSREPSSGAAHPVLACTSSSRAMAEFLKELQGGKAKAVADRVKKDKALATAKLATKTGAFAFPIHHATKANSLETVNALLATTADVNALDSSGDTALHIAAALGDAPGDAVAITGERAELSRARIKSVPCIDEDLTTSACFSHICSGTRQEEGQDGRAEQGGPLALARGRRCGRRGHHRRARRRPRRSGPGGSGHLWRQAHAPAGRAPHWKARRSGGAGPGWGKAQHARRQHGRHAPDAAARGGQGGRRAAAAGAGRLQRQRPGARSVLTEGAQRCLLPRKCLRSKDHVGGRMWTQGTADPFKGLTVLLMVVPGSPTCNPETPGAAALIATLLDKGASVDVQVTARRLRVCCRATGRRRSADAEQLTVLPFAALTPLGTALAGAGLPGDASDVGHCQEGQGARRAAPQKVQAGQPHACWALRGTLQNCVQCQQRAPLPLLLTAIHPPAPPQRSWGSRTRRGGAPWTWRLRPATWTTWWRRSSAPAWTWAPTGRGCCKRRWTPRRTPCWQR